MRSSADPNKSKQEPIPGIPPHHGRPGSTDLDTPDEALRESEARFRTLVENAKDPVFVQTDHCFAYLNPAAVRLFGASTPEQLLGRPVLDRIHPDCRDTAYDRIRIINEQQSPVPILELDYLRLDGAPVPVEVSAAPIQWGGRPGAVVFLRDITERRRAEGMLRFTQFSVDSAADSIFWMTPDGGFVYVNDRACESLGYSREELLSMNVFDIDPLYTPDIRLNDWLQLKQRGAILLETKHRRKNGEVFPIEVSAKYMEYGGKEYNVAFVRDITERKRAEEALHRRSRCLKLLSDSATHLLLYDRPEMAILHVFGALAADLAVDVYLNFVATGDGTGLRLNAFGGIEEHIARRLDGAELAEAISTAVAQQHRPIVIEEVQRSTDPRTQLIRSLGLRAYVCHPLMVRERLTGTLAFGTRRHDRFGAEELDLLHTLCDQVAMSMERRRLTEELARRAEDLAVAKTIAEQANAAKDQFLAVLSHELRTPLTPVLMLSQLLQDDPGLPAAAREDMKTIRQNIQLEARLIDDLLDLNRIARGKVQAKPELVSVHSLLRHAMQTCRDEFFEQKQLKVEWRLSALSDNVSADPARMEQVFWNLIRNAIKFTPPEGTITIRTFNSDTGRIAVQVADTGSGIEPDKLTAIFNPFEQGGPETTRRFGGMGLGLAIAKAVVEMHEGQISAASEGPGKGATFTVTLATAVLQEPPLLTTGSAPTAHAQPPCTTPFRILLVEDHRPTSFVLQRLMKKWGWEATPAALVSSALELASRQQFDLVISDLGLPDGNGHDLMRNLNELYGLRGIALSGYGMEQDVQKSIASGFIQHLVKPVNFDELRRTVSDILTGSANPSSSPA